MKRHVGRAFMSAALIVLVVAGGVFVLASVIDSIVRLENRTWWVAHSYQVIDTSDLILADLAEAESYQRGYLLTGKDSYLSHYEIAAQRSSNRAQALHGMVKDKDAQLARAKDLERLIQSRVASLQKGIDVRKSDGVEAARLYLNQGYGASLMARVRLKSAEMKNAEGQLLDTRKVEERETTAHLRQAVIAAITVLAVMVLAASLIANEVHHNRRKLTDMIDSVGDAFFAMDGKWRISHFNEMAAQFFGLEPAKVIGRRFLEAFPNVAGSELEVTCHAAMQSGKPQALETFLPRIEKHIEVRCFPSREGLSVFCHDISGRVEQERQIQELNELLERRVLDRTAQLETFCYSVAHDMRMHIRGISVNSTMILEELQPGKNPLVREKLERLTIATKQMSRLV
ncbi:MAG TPA: CHASE3 domain-containing protein, partial [Fimbriimonas sp.]|nr:CHASE3 domain-containing protein [Fimbriimonas sp.]